MIQCSFSVLTKPRTAIGVVHLKIVYAIATIDGFVC